MLSSLVDAKRCANVKKRVYMSQVDEFEHSSAPLCGVVLSTIMNSIPYTRRPRPLKEGYVTDLTRNGGISPCAMMLGLLYIKRLSLSSPAYLTSVTPRELFLIAMVVASKYMNDEGELEALTNSDWAKVGSLTKTSLDELERMFLEAIDWRLYVSLEEYYTFVTSIEGQVALAEASRRGWFTYTDLTAIWDASDIQTLMLATSKQTAKVVCGGAAIYLMCVATLLTASHSLHDPLTSITLSPCTHTPLQTNATTDHLGVPVRPLSASTESFETMDMLVVEQRKPPDIFGDLVGGALFKDNRAAMESGDVSGVIRTVIVRGCEGVSERLDIEAQNVSHQWSLDDSLCNGESRAKELNLGQDYQCGSLPVGLLFLLNLTSSFTGSASHSTSMSCDQNTAAPTTKSCDYIGTTPTRKSRDHVVMTTPLETTYHTHCQIQTENNGRHSCRDSQTGLSGFKNKYCMNEVSCTHVSGGANGQSMTSSILDHYGNTVSSPKVDSSFDLNFHLTGTFHWPPVNRTSVSNSEWNPINFTITESVLLYTQSLLVY